MDIVWEAVARAVADGTAIGAGDKVAISMAGIEAYPAAAAVVHQCHARGAQPQVMLSADEFDRDARNCLPIHMLSAPAPLELAAIDWADVYISLRPMTPPTARAGAEDPTRTAAQRLGKGAVSAARWNVKRWMVVRVPTDAWADLAGIDPHILAEELVAGITTDWAAYRNRWQTLADTLTATSQLRLLDVDTDLTLPTTGRTWVSFDGAANLPDGELATAPLDDGTTGHLTLPGPFWFADTRFAGLSLTFEAGQCVHLDADEGAATARALIAADAGSARIGELGIGVNPYMTTMVGDLFHDEKILGTAHIALGRAYPQCGGINRSSIHWDLVKDLRGPQAHLLADNLALISHGVLQPPLTGTTGSGPTARHAPPT